MKEKGTTMGDAAEEEVAHTLAPPAAKSVLYCEGRSRGKHCRLATLLTPACLVCTMPTEYCAYSAAPARCKEWLAEWTRKNSDVSELVGGLSLAPEAEGKEKDGDDDGDDEDDEGKKRQTRGGKAMPRDGSKKSEKEEAKRKVGGAPQFGGGCGSMTAFPSYNDGGVRRRV